MANFFLKKGCPLGQRAILDLLIFVYFFIILPLSHSGFLNLNLSKIGFVRKLQPKMIHKIGTR
jgi:hypothetical protein